MCLIRATGNGQTSASFVHLMTVRRFFRRMRTAIGIIIYFRSRNVRRANLENIVQRFLSGTDGRFALPDSPVNAYIFCMADGNNDLPELHPKAAPLDAVLKKIRMTAPRSAWMQIMEYAKLLNHECRSYHRAIQSIARK
jgi:hypothetical protein